jgi:hypothetical protein
MSRKRFLGLSHYLVLAIVLVSLLTLLIPVSEVKADSVVVFPDANLDAAIREIIHKASGDIIYQSDLTYFKVLSSGIVDNHGIVDLTGLEYCTSLEWLWLKFNQISDLSPLAGLPNLQSLMADSNQIRSLSPLASCPKLSYVEVSNNQITTLASIASLEYLNVSSNQISDLSPLAGCPNLTRLDLGNNQISDLSPLTGLTNLTQLGLYDNQISDLSPLTGLTNLNSVALQDNQVSDIEPLVNNLWMGSGAWLRLQCNPLSSESINTWIPALKARGVIVEWDSPEITGSIEDGYGHKLGGVEVTLLFVSPPAGPTTQAVTIADNGGKYSFADIGPGDYQIEIALECHEVVGDTATFSINYDVGPSVRARTDTFQVTCGAAVVKDISLADPSLIPVTAIPSDRLDDLALMYYHVKQVVDFEWTVLGVTLDLNLPVEVHGYVSSTPAKAYYDPNDGNVYIGANRSDYSVRTKPWTPDWHEMFHQLMDDAVGLPPDHIGDTNHGGYANHCTGDSWVEGWAEFWPCALARSLGIPEWYLFWGTTSLEQNWMVWDRSGGYSREEFAVASLLVDLVDPVNPPEYDFLSLTNSQLWAIIGSKQLADMFEVYSALAAANIGQTDYDADGISDLDALFIAHGFFADDGNGAYDGETVGLGGKPGRQSTLLIPNAYLRIIVEDSRGDQISDGTLLVDVEFASPLDIYNYSFEVSLHGSDDLVYFEVGPDRYDALMKMRVKDGDGTLSDELVVSNSVYWDRVGEATEGYAAEHTFVIGAEGKTTVVGASGTTSGGVPVWIWPIVGVVAVAAGAGGFFLFFILPRRKAKPS